MVFPVVEFPESLQKSVGGLAEGMKLILTALLMTCLVSFSAGKTIGKGVEKFVKKAEEVHGEFGKKAADYLVEGMSEDDAKNLSAELLIENLDYAMKARKKFKWCQDLPEEVFFNDVLPYAVFDETRELWRKEFFEKCGELVKDCKTAEDAAQTLNREFFNQIKGSL